MPNRLALIVVTASFVPIQAFASPQIDSQSLERVRAALQASQVAPAPLELPPATGTTTPLWGGLTLVQPDSTRGEMVKVEVPAGELTMRAFRAVSAAHHRRAERKAREEVERALKDF